MPISKQTHSGLLVTLVAGLCSLPLFSFSQWAAAQGGDADHKLIDRFPDSQIIERELQREANHRVVLGGLERVRGEVIPENSERLNGDVTRIMYEVPQTFRGEDVYQFFQEQIASRGYEVLFDCRGRGCGNSNYWANDIFRNRILYGPESDQYYTAFRASPSLENAAYFSIYIITRVNRRIYAYLEVIEPGGAQESSQIAMEQNAVSQTGAPASLNNASLLQRLTRQGSVVLPDIVFGQNDELAAAVDLGPIVAALNADSSLTVYLVAHLKEEGQSLELLTRRSTVRATALRQALITAGIEAGRIEAAGVGPLAPTCAQGSCEDRVELVLR
ncbi:MAG: DUF4892 domain-containing protein [Pseudohongiellaceae bacterium]